MLRLTTCIFFLTLILGCAGINRKEGSLNYSELAESCESGEVKKTAGKGLQFFGGTLLVVGVLPTFILVGGETDINFDGDQNGDDVSVFAIGLGLMFIGDGLVGIGKKWQYHC